MSSQKRIPHRFETQVVEWSEVVLTHSPTHDSTLELESRLGAKSVSRFQFSLSLSLSLSSFIFFLNPLTHSLTHSHVTEKTYRRSFEKKKNVWKGEEERRWHCFRRRLWRPPAAQENLQERLRRRFWQHHRVWGPLFITLLC